MPTKRRSISNRQLESATLDRGNLEKGVSLIEEGLISRDPGLFVEDYMLYVANQRATSVAYSARFRISRLDRNILHQMLMEIKLLQSKGGKSARLTSSERKKE